MIVGGVVLVLIVLEALVRKTHKRRSHLLRRFDLPLRSQPRDGMRSHVCRNSHQVGHVRLLGVPDVWLGVPDDIR